MLSLINYNKSSFCQFILVSWELLNVHFHCIQIPMDRTEALSCTWAKGRQCLLEMSKCHTDTENIRNQSYCPDNGVLSADPIRHFNTSSTWRWRMTRHLSEFYLHSASEMLHSRLTSTHKHLLFSFLNSQTRWSILEQNYFPLLFLKNIVSQTIYTC